LNPPVLVSDYFFDPGQQFEEGEEFWDGIQVTSQHFSDFWKNYFEEGYAWHKKHPGIASLNSFLSD
jgi:hypothetical protein